ncbi:transglutaminase domain-containing protein [Candidatus Nanohalococcus occultus]|uniref:transglutaminase domain-containing protein n=1 Tax=Candidatus Nanohalococcus occultus TaxID=2978047 RepID=UPI0039DF5BD8
MLQRREFLAASLTGISALSYRRLPSRKTVPEKSGSKLEEFDYDFEEGCIYTPEDFSFQGVEDIETGWLPDYWQSVDETYERGTGDCEDYAILHAAALHRQGYRARVVIGLVEEQKSWKEKALETLGVNHSLTETAYEGDTYIIDVLKPDSITPLEDYQTVLEDAYNNPDVTWHPKYSFSPDEALGFYEKDL